MILNTAVRTGSDYAVEVSVKNSTQAAALIDSQVTFWGTPGDVRHNSSRGWECVGDRRLATEKPCEPFTGEAKAFLTLPTTCGPAPRTTVTGDSWPTGGSVDGLEGAYTFAAASSNCGLLDFKPTITAKASTARASTPTGLTVDVSVPQASTISPGGLAEADVQDTTVTLPEGVQASPAAANGLLACSSGNVGLEGVGVEGEQLQNDHFSREEEHCPEASRIGSVSIRTPLLKEPLEGGVYLASQDTNPFASPLVLYVMAYDPISGVRVKLAGESASTPRPDG